MSQGFFITGTDTGIGKTTASLALMPALQHHGLRVAAMKPVAAGCEHTPQGLRNDDALQLMQQSSVQLPYELVNPYTYEPAIAPHIAAQQADRPINIPHIVDCYQQIASQADVVIVEGAGGWLVPLNDNETLADLACALQLPVINIVGIRLGCLNHALLTTQSIAASNLALAGWIANHVEPHTDVAAENIQTLVRRIDAKLLGRLPYSPDAAAKSQASKLDISTLLTR
jgi:dethiobiotin synthetase